MKKVISSIAAFFIFSSSLCVSSVSAIEELPFGIENESNPYYTEYTDLRGYDMSISEYVSRFYGENAVYRKANMKNYVLDENCKIHTLEAESYPSITMKEGCYPPAEEIVSLGIGKPYIDKAGETRLVFPPFYHTIGAPENVYRYNFDNAPCAGVSASELNKLAYDGLLVLENDENVISIGETTVIKNWYTNSFAIEICDRNKDSYERFYNEYKDDLYLIKHPVENGYDPFSFELKYGTFNSADMYKTLKKLFESDYDWAFTGSIYLHWEAGYIPSTDNHTEEQLEYLKQHSFLDYYTEQTMKENGDLRYLEFSKTVGNTLNDDNSSIESVQLSIYGDINFDKSIDLTDMLMISQKLLGDLNFTESQKSAADVNVDGEISISDLAVLKQYIMGDKIKLGV